MGNFLCKNILCNSPFLLVSLYLETFNSLIRSIETSSPLVAINIELECWKSVLCFAKVKNFAPRPDFLWLSSLKLRTQSWSLVLVLLSCLSSQKGKIVTLAPPLDSPTLIFFASSSVTLPVLCPPPSNSNMRLRDILSMEQNQISIFRNVSNILPSHPTVVTTLKTVFNKGNNGKVSLPVPYFNKDLHTYTYFF